MPVGYDHIVIAVDDLNQTIADYTALGFTVLPGGEHQHGISHNALVPFRDGSYFELIAFRNNGEGHGTHWPITLSKGEGFVDFALRTNDLENELHGLRAAGLNYSNPRDGGRFRPDGQRIDWQTIRYGSGATVPSRMPFFCHDLTDRPLRVPDGEAVQHANGVTGIAGVTVVVADLEAASKDYAALTKGVGVDIESTVRDVARSRRFPIGSAWVELVQPSKRESELRTYLETRGELPYEVTLVSLHGHRELLPDRQTHGARLLMISDSRVSA